MATSSNILITGGIGDIVALDSLWTAHEKAEVEVIHWATRSGRQMIPIFGKFAEYSSLSTQVDHWDYDQRKVFAFHHAHQVRIGGVALPDGTVDRSIWYEFPRHRTEGCRYQGSSFLAHDLAEIDHLRLPERYAVVVHDTPINLDPVHRKLRNYTPDDWSATLDRLERLGIPGVMVNMKSDAPVPDHPLLIDLRGRTTLEESIEVVKRCDHYVGIDSWASIVAAMVHEDGERLRVLSRNPHLYHNLRSYYPRHCSWSFVGRSIGA